MINLTTNIYWVDIQNPRLHQTLPELKSVARNTASYHKGASGNRRTTTPFDCEGSDKADSIKIVRGLSCDEYLSLVKTTSFVVVVLADKSYLLFRNPWLYHIG
eukprot:scaffold8818_cov73-Cyclotella_meneghiniana.AAC.2